MTEDVTWVPDAGLEAAMQGLRAISNRPARRKPAPTVEPPPLTADQQRLALVLYQADYALNRSAAQRGPSTNACQHAQRHGITPAALARAYHELAKPGPRLP